MGAGRNHIHIINMKFERELSKPLYAVTVNKGLWVSLSHPIYDFLNRKNFSCFVINEHHAYQHRIVTNCINNILRSNMMRIWIWRYISYLPSARFQIRTSFQNGIVFNGSCYNMKIRLGVGTIIANSESFRKVVELAQRVATFDGATVLILGESGTGKELVSELLVNNSPRKDMPYLQVNCGAIPENLIESELFGYEKGAFTGADNRGHKGLFEAANGGTVFLDEIGDLPLHMQVKLLRVLQQRKVTRVGGTEPIDINVRVIAATNKNLEQMVREGQFREDLYYRLNVVSVQIPPLRERKEDIVPLLNHFLTVVNQKYHTQKTIFPDTIDAFENYPWPGNVRELENVLENLVITTPGDEIRRENLPKKFWSENGEPAAVGMREILPLKVTVERVELAAIQHAIDQCGSVRKAAAALGVDPSTIVRKMQGHKEK